MRVHHAHVSSMVLRCVFASGVNTWVMAASSVFPSTAVGRVQQFRLYFKGCTLSQGLMLSQAQDYLN
jgi:hypothetical protein